MDETYEALPNKGDTWMKTSGEAQPITKILLHKKKLWILVGDEKNWWPLHVFLQEWRKTNVQC